MTFAVDLPGGLALDDGRQLVRAELHPLTGREEDWLAAHPDAPSALATSFILGNCLTRVGDESGDIALARRLLVGDRDCLMLRLRQVTLGERISAVLVCPSCGSKMDVDLSISDVPIERRPQSSSAFQVEIGNRGRAVRFRLPTGADQEATLGLDPAAAVDRLWECCLIDDGGVPLSFDEREQVEAEMERLAPRLDLELDLTCPDCAATFVAPFDTTRFFLDETRTSGKQLLREIHTLALFYHWTETEVLSLTRQRRRAYLDLLAEAFPGER